jgi:hypothetical protein
MPITYIEELQRSTRMKNGETVLTKINKKVLYYEIHFDVFHETHMRLRHPRDVRSHETLIEDLWRGCTKDAIKTYRDFCPECLCKAKMSCSKIVQQLQFMFSENIGAHAQVDWVGFH